MFDIVDFFSNLHMMSKLQMIRRRFPLVNSLVISSVVIAQLSLLLV